MSTLLVAAVLVGLLVLLVVLFLKNENRKKQNHMNQFINRFRELGSLNNLSFSSQVMLKNAAIGLDGMHRQLLILTGSNENSFSNRLIDLNEVKNCSVKKLYGSIGASGLKNTNLENYLEKISLHFEMKNGKAPAEINFYHHIYNDVYEISEMTDKARDWELILSKMLKAPANGKVA